MPSSLLLLAVVVQPRLPPIILSLALDPSFLLLLWLMLLAYLLRQRLVLLWGLVLRLHLLEVDNSGGLAAGGRAAGMSGYGRQRQRRGKQH